MNETTITIVTPRPGSETSKRDYLEITDEKGVAYRIQNWTDEEWIIASMSHIRKDDQTTPEELFDV